MDHVLVPYYNINVKMIILEEVIVYDQLSEAEKSRCEEDFTDEDEGISKYAFWHAGSEGCQNGVWGGSGGVLLVYQ